MSSDSDSNVGVEDDEEKKIYQCKFEQTKPLYVNGNGVSVKE